MLPFRYFLNDFETSVYFEPESDPATRRVSGLPLEDTGRAGEYNRDIAPEVNLPEPYCPFRCDVWQLGKVFKRSFAVRFATGVATTN